jgi:hypothetical protein
MRAVYKAVFVRPDRTQRIVYFTAPQDEELTLTATAALVADSPRIPATEGRRARLTELYQIDQVE